MKILANDGISKSGISALENEKLADENNGTNFVIFPKNKINVKTSSSSHAE